MKRRDLEKHLKAHGCYLARHWGGHDFWNNPTTNKQAAVPRHSEIATFTTEAICKDLQIPKAPKR